MNFRSNRDQKLSQKKTSEVPAVTLLQKTDLAGALQLDIYKVKAPTDMVVKKVEGEEVSFVTGKGKKSKKGTKTSGLWLTRSLRVSTSSSCFHISLPTLIALPSLSTPPPGLRMRSHVWSRIPRLRSLDSRLAAKEKAKAGVEALVKRIFKSIGEAPVIMKMRALSMPCYECTHPLRCSLF